MLSDADCVMNPGQLSDADGVVQALTKAPELGSWSRQEIAQIIPYARERHLQPGEVLYRQGDPAQEAFCLINGKLRVGVGSGHDVASGFVGQEAALGITSYLADLVAVDAVTVLAVPGAVLQDIGSEQTKATLHHSLLSHYTTPRVEIEAQKTLAAEQAETISPTKIVGWLLTLVAAASVLVFGEGYGLNWHQQNFLAVLSVCLFMWLFNLVPQYAAAMIAGLGCLVLDVAPTQVILSGFAAGGFFMALSIFGLGSVLISSGLATRLVLNILKFSPPTPFWYNCSMLLTGLLMTPCLPSANARIGLMTPLLIETSRALGYQDRSREATRLMLSMFMGASFFAPIFLTSKSLNFVVYTIMPQQVREEFQWLTWTMAASVAGGIMFVLYLVVSSYLFRGGKPPRLSRQHLTAQLRVLGPMDLAEWTALGSSLLFIVAIVTYSTHKISPFWITLGVFCAFLISGTLQPKHLRSDIEWHALLLIGFFIGLANALSYTGIGALLTQQLAGITAYMSSNFAMFVVLMLLVISVMRLFLPITTAGILVASVFLPLAKLNGVHPWVVSFVIIMLSECWLLPFQCSYFQTFEAVSGTQPAHDRTLFLQVNAITVGIRILALFVSLPFFRHIGLL